MNYCPRPPFGFAPAPQGTAPGGDWGHVWAAQSIFAAWTARSPRRGPRGEGSGFSHERQWKANLSPRSPLLSSLLPALRCCLAALSPSLCPPPSPLLCYAIISLAPLFPFALRPLSYPLLRPLAGAARRGKWLQPRQAEWKANRNSWPSTAVRGSRTAQGKLAVRAANIDCAAKHGPNHIGSPQAVRLTTASSGRASVISDACSSWSPCNTHKPRGD